MEEGRNALCVVCRILCDVYCRRYWMRCLVAVVAGEIRWGLLIRLQEIWMVYTVVLSVYRAGIACCSVLQCGAVCCSVVQCVAVCCSVLQCVAACCSVLQCVAVCLVGLSCCHRVPSYDRREQC